MRFPQLTMVSTTELSSMVMWDFSGSSGDLKHIPAMQEALGSFSPEGNGNPLQYSCLETPWMEKPGEIAKGKHD